MCKPKWGNTAWCAPRMFKGQNPVQEKVSFPLVMKGDRFLHTLAFLDFAVGWGSGALKI